jgi:hypothetical protein
MKMANLQTAFIARSQVPSRQALQDAVKNLRFKLTVDESWVAFESRGYMPCTLDGEDAGFDVRFSDSAAQLAEFAALQAQIGDRDTAISFRWGGDMRERVSAMIVCAVLAQACDALVLRQGDDDFLPAELLLVEARQAFAQLQEQ